jgi:hypothetical protein
MRLFLVIFFFLVTGCTTTSSVMNSWVGRNINDVVQSWGPPTNQFSGGGTTTYSWTNFWSNQYQINQCVQSFTVNSSGTITNFSYNNCPRLQRMF